MSRRKKPQHLILPEYIVSKDNMKNDDARSKISQIVEAISLIYARQASKLSFQHLYTNGYQVVLHKKGNELYDRVEKTIQKFISGIREKLMSRPNSVFLDKLLEKWAEHTTALQMVRDILMYLDRTYVHTKKKQPIYEMGVQLFGKQVFQKNALERILRLIMSIIQKERNGEIISNRFQLRDLCRMMLEISKREIYVKHFENTFLKESREFFQTEANFYFANNTSTIYLDKVLQRLKEERGRSRRCFDKETLAKIENVVKTEMIENYKRTIITKEGSGCAVMLKMWKIQDLKKVYDVLGLVKGALSPLIDLVHNFCIAEGNAIIADKEKDSKPLEMVEEMIKLWEKYDNLLTVSFSKRMKKTNDLIRDEEFSKTVRKAFNELVNKHERLPEYMSLYIDSKLRVGKNSIEESEFDVLFEQVIRLFRHLREKDIFEKYYKIHLGKRLLGNKSQSHEAERSFISKLKTEFGYQFTSKIEGMFTDIKLNKETMDNFKKYYRNTKGKEKIGYDMSVQVLTSGYWPLPMQQSIVLNIPPLIQKAQSFFEDFYISAHSGRKLTWKLNMGNADVRANGFSRPYELNVSTYQLMILELFNQESTFKLGGIQSQTNIPFNELKAQLRTLTSKTKTHDRVLKRERTKVISKDTRYKANNLFKSKMIKVKIVHVKMKQSKDDLKRTHQKIDEERKWQLDACIVRIMKMRKKLQHRNLVMEVTKQLQTRFVPSPDIIKKRIESLIEREYLERSKENRTIYNYLA